MNRGATENLGKQSPSRDGGLTPAKVAPRDDPKEGQSTAQTSIFCLAESHSGWLQERFQGA
jgi:hypothetical protein